MVQPRGHALLGDGLRRGWSAAGPGPVRRGGLPPAHGRRTAARWWWRGRHLLPPRPRL